MQTQSRKKQGLLQGKSKKQLLILLAGLVLGILLLLVGNGAFEKKSETPQKETARAEQENYRTDLEKRVEALCEAVKGVSAAKAMVSLSSGYTTVYESDANGSPATVGSGNTEAALPQTVRPPSVIGVGVVCKGGDDPQIQQQLTELLSTALGIPSNRVCIVGK